MQKYIYTKKQLHTKENALVPSEMKIIKQDRINAGSVVCTFIKWFELPYIKPFSSFF